MSTLELRKKIFKQLESVDDNLLKEVLALIEFETEKGLFKLSDAQKLVVDKSRSQIASGETFTNEEVDKEIDAWLNE